MCHFSKAFPTPALHCGPPRPGCRRSEESGAGFVGRRVVAGGGGWLKHLVWCRALQDSSQDGLFTIQRASQPSQGRVHPRSCVAFTLLRKQNIWCFARKLPESLLEAKPLLKRPRGQERGQSQPVDLRKTWNLGKPQLGTHRRGTHRAYPCGCAHCGGASEGLSLPRFHGQGWSEELRCTIVMN